MSDWNTKQKASFVQTMGRRQKFAKGGMVKKLAKKKYFDDGGTVKTMQDPNTVLKGPSAGGAVENAVNPNTGIAGTIGGALGLNNNFRAGAANIQAGTNAAQLNNSYTGAQGALTNQGNLVNTLSPQVGGAVQNQNALAQQLYGMTQGEGPNPAQMELNQATGQNVANQAALMAGQRGAQANAGLLARQAAQQGADIQQQAAGQSATLQAQQQIAAQNNLANLANAQIGQAGQAVSGLNSAQQNEQALLQNANTSYNNAAVGMQSNINNVNSQTAAANQNVAGKLFGGATSAISNGLSSVGSLFAYKGGAIEKEHHVKLAEMNAASLHLAGGGQLPGNPLIGQSPQAMAPSNWAAQYFNPGSASSGPNIQATSALPTSSAPLYVAPKKAEDENKPTPEQTDEEAQEGYHLANAMLGSNNQEVQLSADNMGDAQMVAHGGKICTGPYKSHVANYLFAKGGAVPAMVSPGEIYLSPEKVHQVLHEDADPAKIGHRFKGKAKVKGDSLKNDIIPATLQDGGVVIDRENMGSKEKRQLFVHKAIARKKAGK